VSNSSWYFAHACTYTHSLTRHIPHASKRDARRVSTDEKEGEESSWQICEYKADSCMHMHIHMSTYTKTARVDLEECEAVSQQVRSAYNVS
jgi:hypothetical protein